MTLAELKEIIKSKYLHHGDYTLSSGAKSSTYFDIKGMMGDPNDVNVLRLELEEFVFDIDRECLGGTELGGALIVAMMAQNMGHLGVSSCYIRKQQRIHGLKKMIEGCPKSPILLVDDVISSAATSVAAVLECWKNKFDVCGILCVINRSGKDTLPISEGSNPEIPIYSLFKESDFD